jgi:hypothetical protein
MSMEWLLANAPGFNDLTADERSAVVDFALLWCLFEARILSNAGNARNIRAVVNRWDEAGTLEPVVTRAISLLATALLRERQFYLPLRPSS